jgi:hypothetical protein
MMGTSFLVCHGAWSAGWAWKKMHPLMSAAGHRLVTPTYTTRITPAETFAPFARREPGWRYSEIDASHSPNVTAPEALSKLLQKIVAGGE